MTIDELKEYVDRQFKELKDYTDERSRNIETTLLREFRKWAVRIDEIDEKGSQT
jgi:hypothetical protein